MKENPPSKISLIELARSAGLRSIPIEVSLPQKPKVKKLRLNKRTERIYINKQHLEFMEKKSEERRMERINPDAEREQALGENIEDLRELREELKRQGKTNNL